MVERIGLKIEDNLGNILDLTDKDQYFITKLDGLDHPALRMNKSQLAGRDGSFLGRQNYNGRTVTIEGIYRFMGINQSRSRDQRFISRADFLCKISRFRNPLTLKITETLDSGSTVEYQLECKLSEYKSPVEHSALQFEFTLNMLSEFPFLQSGTENNIVLSQAFIKPGDQIPDQIPDIIGTYPPGLNDAINNGCIPTYPRIYYSGPQVQPITISNTTNGTTLTLNTDLVTGDAIEIDNYKKTVIKNGSVNVISAKSGDWLTLDPGSNIMLFSYGTGTTGSTTLFWRANFLGL